MKAGQLKLRRAEFRSWLSSRRDVIVGCSADERLCPLASWLFDLTGTDYGVGCDGFYGPTHDRTRSRRLPRWAFRFVRALDCTFTGEFVTGEEALTLIEDAIVRETLCVKPVGHSLVLAHKYDGVSFYANGTSCCLHCHRVFVCPGCRPDHPPRYIVYRCSSHRPPCTVVGQPLEIDDFGQKKTASLSS